MYCIAHDTAQNHASTQKRQKTNLSLSLPKQEGLRSPPPVLASMAASSSTAPAAPSTEAGVLVAADGAEGAPSEAPARTRSSRPHIDLDGSIAQARQAMKAAQKEVAEARRQARNERRENSGWSRRLRT